MLHRSIHRPVILGLGAFATICLLTGCGDPDSGTAAGAAASSAAAASAAPSDSSAGDASDTPSADAPTTEATEAVSAVPLATAVPSETPSVSAAPTTTTERATSADGVFSVAIPAGATQDPGTNSDTVSSITLDRPGNGNLELASLRYSKPQITITSWFSLELGTLADAFPSCTFPHGANVIGEKLGGKADANYRVYTCDAFPGTYTIFTANGPNGELLSGHDQDFTGGGQTWKAVVLSAQTLKKP